MRYEVSFSVKYNGGASKRSKIFNFSSLNQNEVEKEIRRYFNIPSGTPIEIHSIKPE